MEDKKFKKNLKPLAAPIMVAILTIAAIILFFISPFVLVKIFALIAIILSIYYFYKFKKGTIKQSLNALLFVINKIIYKKYIPYIIITFSIFIIFGSYLIGFYFFQQKHPNLIDPSKHLVLDVNFEKKQNQTIIDQSGQKNNGKMLGSAAILESGKVGRALKTNGKNDYVDFKKWTKPFTSKNYTISAWVYVEKFPENNTYNYIIYRTDDAPSIRFNGNGSKLLFAIDSNHGQLIKLQTEPINYIKKWTHVALTYNGKIAKAYINGKLKKSKELKMEHYLESQPLKLAWDGAKKRNLNGKLDQIKIYKTALIQPEIKKLYLLKKGHPYFFSNLFKNISTACFLIIIFTLFVLLVLKRAKNETKNQKTK